MKLKDPQHIPGLANTILNNISDEIVIVDLEGIIIYRNPAAVKTFSKSAEDMLGKHISEFNPDFDPKIILPEFDKNGYQPINKDWHFTHAENKSSWLDSSLSPFYDDSGELIGILAVIKDITQKKQVELELNQNRKWLSRALELGQTGIWDWNLHTEKPFWSQKMLEIYGYESLEDIPSFKTWEKTIYPDDKEFVMRHIMEALEENKKYNIIFRIWNGTEKSIKYLHAIGEVIIDELDKVPHLRGVARDVSSWKTTENQLIESLRFNSNIIKYALEGIFVLDPELTCLIWNPKLEKLLGKKAGHVLGKNIMEGLEIQGHKKEAYQRIFRKVLRGSSETFEDVFFVENEEGKQKLWLKILLSPNLKEDGKGNEIIGIISDITESREREEVLAETSERLRLATETARIGIWKHDFESNTSQWNDQLFQMLGIDPDLLEASPEIWQELFHPDDRADAINNLQRLANGEEVLNIEFRIIRPDGEIRYINASGKGISDSKGNILQGIGVNVDVSHLKKHERSLRQKNEELEKINKALDTFVYHTSHNLRAPLANIQGILEILSNNPTEAEKDRFLNYATENVENMDRTIQTIIDYSYNSRIELSREHVKVSKLVNSVVNSLSFMDHRQKVNIINAIPGELTVFTDVDRLRMVFLNLLSNSLKYFDRSKPLPYVKITYKSNEDIARFIIEDNGIGIAEAHQNSIFQMFVRATDQGKGSGLGLYIVKEVMTNLGGNIRFESTDGKGTCFYIEIPR
ncbi:MAG: PAS domain-containing sensor histidine kinase [Bacteroidia bacterium]|nr:PAS domain-containing sensor histidine kinase [Bacteroidia bacterium]